MVDETTAEKKTTTTTAHEMVDTAQKRTAAANNEMVDETVDTAEKTIAANDETTITTTTANDETTTTTVDTTKNETTAKQIAESQLAADIEEALASAFKAGLGSILQDDFLQAMEEEFPKKEERLIAKTSLVKVLIRRRESRYPHGP